MAGFLAEKGQVVLRNGYNVIPIKPGGKFPIIDDAQTVETTPAHIRKWLSNGHRNDGIGITTRWTPLVDIDVFDAEVALEMENWVHLHIGLASVRIGNAPKRGLLFRTETPFTKVRSRDYVDDEGREVHVEILAAGQQFVAYAIHPDTHSPYLWPGKHSGPEFELANDLPTITQEQAREVVAEFERIATERGWPVQQKARPNATPVDDEFGLGLDPVGLPEADLRDKLMLIPNDDRFAARDDWLQIGFAIHHETNGSDFGHELFHDWSVQHHTHKEDLLEKAWRSFGKSDTNRRPTTFRYILKLAKEYEQKNDPRPTIVVRAGALHLIASEAEAALLTFDAPLYTRGHQIVRPIIEYVEAAKGQQTKAARLTAVSADSLVDWMSRAAKWARFDARAKKQVSTDPPRQVAAVVSSRDGEWSFRPLVGVITTPTLRPDGSLLTEAGYDPATRLLLLQPPPLPPIPAKPSRRDALIALAMLDSLLNEFPFVDDASRSVALSAQISPVVRGALSVVPLHMVTAPTAGSGKSYIIDVAAGIATGQKCPVIAAGKSEEETEKRLGAALIAGQTIVSIDNLNGELEGDFLCQAIERPIIKVRILGKSELVQVESRASIFATGNNITIRGDMLRRTIRCALDPNLERPELREFRQNPFETVIANRGTYIAAALTIVRAYVEAGCPGQLRPLVSFEDWSGLVRSALVWLGRADPLDSMETAREEDPEIRTARQIVAAWYETTGSDNPKFISELIATANSTEFDDETDNLNLGQALTTLGRDSLGVSAHRVGQWLKRNNGRIIDGLKICATENRKTKTNRWWLADYRPADL